VLAVWRVPPSCRQPSAGQSRQAAVGRRQNRVRQSDDPSPPAILASIARILGDVERSRRFEQAVADVRAVREWLERMETERAMAAEREER
jgi:hypothetical protein